MNELAIYALIKPIILMHTLNKFKHKVCYSCMFDRPVIDQNFYYAGLKYTSPTFSCAMSNMLPAMTFIMAVIFR